MNEQPRYQITISRYAPAYSEDRKSYSYWQEYAQFFASSFRLDKEREVGGNIPSSHFRAYPVKGERDFEGDQCSLAIFDIELPKVDLLWMPTIEVIGHVREMSAYSEIDPDGEGDAPRYSPPEDEAWTPCVVKVQIRDLVSWPVES